MGEKIMSVEDNTNIQFAQINELLKRFSEKAYSSKTQDVKDEIVIDICIKLWKLDYRCEVIDNKNGSLCSTYPSRIIVPVYEVGAEGEVLSATPLSDSIQLESTETPAEERENGIHLDETDGNPCHSKDSDVCDNKVYLINRRYENGRKKYNHQTFSSVVAKTNPQKNGESRPNGTLQGVNGSTHPLQQKFTLREYFQKAIKARCRYRFPIPCVLCKGKYISRSATLSCYIDVIGKQILHSSDSHHDCEDELTWHSNDLDRARAADINLLEAIGTSCIVDLMVENKKVKYSINVSSSEKADKENRYCKFSITSIPYPGCEFFKEFTQQKFKSSNLYYNWEQAFNDAALSLADDEIQEKVTSDWDDYKSWDLRKMTENYLKLILRYIIDEDSKETGCLVHCISGWDRTPLFVSLVRLSLWADGLVHSSLDAKQMLFFTLAYDWYLYGHQLPDRLKSKENILYFCFEFLEEIYKDSFMDAAEKRERHHSTSSCTSGAYDSATGGLETPASSFGSATSLASSTSSTPAPPPGASASQSTSIKVPLFNEDSHWPFNKENGFSFDGISDNGLPSKDLIPPPSESAVNGPSGGGSPLLNGRGSSSPSRSPLKERNKGSSKITPSPGGLKGGGATGFRKVNGFLRDLPGRRSRKTSTTEPPSTRFYTGSESIEINTQSEISGCDVESLSSSSSSGTVASSVCASNPVPVPGGRSRHNSSSSVGSWQLLSISDPLEGNDCHRSSRTSLTADMVDSTHTIKEEVTPSSSLESSQSIIVFNRKRRLTEIRDMFFKVYSQEVPSLYPEWSFLSEIVQNIYQKLGT